MPASSSSFWEHRGAEEDVRLLRTVTAADLLSDELGHRPHITGVIKPAPDATDRQFFKGGIRLTQTLQLAKARSTGADREVGIQRKNDDFVNSVRLDIANRGFREWMPVTHCDVARGINPTLTQQTLEIPGLLFRDPSER